MYCKKCGAVVSDNAKFCGKCGTAVIDPISQTKSSGKTHPPRLRKILVLLLVVLAVILLSKLAFGGRSYEKTIDRYIEASMTADAKSIVELMPEDYITTSIAMGEVESKSEFIQVIQETADSAKEYRDDAYGSRWKYQYEIIDTATYTTDQMDMYLYYNDYGNMAEDVSEIMEASCLVEIYTSDTEEIIEITLTLVKIGSKWYIADTT